MGKAGGFDKLVESMYDAAGSPELWPEVMSALADYAGAFGAYLFYWKKRENAYWFSAPSRRLRTRANELYGERYWTLDAALPQLCRTPPGEFHLCQDHFDDRYVKRSEFYNDFLMPVAGVRYRAGTRMVDDGNVIAILAVHRSARQGPFEARDVQLLKRIVPHVTRAAELHLRISNFAAREAMLACALDRIPWGAIVVDDRCKVLVINAAAEAIVMAGDGLRLCGGRLTAAQPEETRGLESQVAEAVKTASGAAHRPGDFLAVTRASSDCPLTVMVAPITPRTATHFGRQRPAALIFVAAPERQPGLSIAQLCRVFRLTAAEARLADALAAGMTLGEIAAGHGLSKNTIRNQVRVVFSKTGTHRQAELVRLLSGLLRFPPEG